MRMPMTEMKIPMTQEMLDVYFPSGAKIFKKRELPKIKYKRKGIEYEVSDLTLLNPIGIDVFKQIVAMAANDETLKEASFTVSPDVDDEILKTTIAIVTGVSYTAKKKGRNGWRADGSYLAYGCRTTHSKDGRKTLTFLLDNDEVKHLAEYAKDHKEINLYEAIEHHITKRLKEARDHIEGIEE